MTKEEQLLRAAAEIVSMPAGMNSQQQAAFVLTTTHLKGLTFSEVKIAMKMVGIMEVLADGI